MRQRAEGEKMTREFKSLYFSCTGKDLKTQATCERFTRNINRMISEGWTLTYISEEENFYELNFSRDREPESCAEKDGEKT